MARNESITQRPSLDLAASNLPETPGFLSQQVTAAQRFFLPIEKRPPNGLAVICGGWEDCARDYAIDRKSFPYVSVEYVAAGEGELTLAGRTYELRTGMVFSYGPGVAHRMRTSAQHRLRKYFVNFSGERALMLLKACGVSPGTAIQLKAHADVRIALDVLIRLALENHASVPRMCALQLELVLLEMKHSTEPISASGRRSLATFERCVRKIDAEFLKMRTVEEAAHLCHLDPSYLSRLFRRFRGLGPLRYIQQRQMQWAAQRLLTSDALVREVADELGIDAFQFSRTFKRMHGVAPSIFLETRR